MMYIYSLQFAADHMGISSLDDYRRVTKSLYSVKDMQNYCNKDLVQLLTPTPTPD